MWNDETSAAVVEVVNAAAAREPSSLRKRSLVESADFVVESVECRCGSAEWSPLEASARYGIVFVRQGCFHRRVNGLETFVDPTVVYFERPDDHQQISHPAGGDSCAVLYLSDALIATLFGGELGLPGEPLATDASTDLGHRLLLAAIARGAAGNLAEAVIALAANVLELSVPDRVAAGRPSTALARRRIVNEAREALICEPGLGVIELARLVSVSPHHLSRVFKAESGETISRYRNRLRVRLALDRIAEGEPCLARLAAELGFSDQAHLARVIRAELGATASELRGLLAAA